MIARLALCVLATALALPACSIQLGAVIELGPPTIRLEPAETLYATRSATISLPQGETVLQLPLGELKASPADVVAEVAPSDCVEIVGARTAADPAATFWRLRAKRAVEATLSLTYPVKGLDWAVEYAATLSPDGSLDLAGSLRVTNGLERDLVDARLVADRLGATVSLDAGEAITTGQQHLCGTIRAESVCRQMIYDRDRYGDAPVEVLTVEVPSAKLVRGISIVGRISRLSGPLPEGTARIYTGGDGGAEFMCESTVPYTPAGRPLELRLGPVSGVVVTHTLDESKEVDQRLDARDRIATYDLLETHLLEVRNLRESPVRLQLRQHHDGYWKIERATEEHDRPDAATVVFDIELEAGATRDITYRIRMMNREP